MHSMRIAGVELKRLLSDRRIRLATIVISVVPLLYGALYLWAFWNPYKQMNDLPVALVNLDRPAKADGKTLSAGKDLAKEILGEETFQWHEVSAKEATDGLKHGRYYLSLTIPADFSTSLATADSAHPVKARLRVVDHESANMLASQIGDRVFSAIREAASVSASRSYLDRIFVGFSDTGKQLSTAALGAKDLASGIAQARDGAAQLRDGLGTASSGSVELASGVTKLAQGATALHTGAGTLAGGIGTLGSGLSTAKSGAVDLYAGSRGLSTGAATLAGGMTQLSQGSAQAAAAAKQVSAGATQVSAGVQQTAAQLQTAASGAASVHQGTGTVLALLQQYASANASAAADPVFRMALGAAQQTDAGAGTLASGISAGAPQLAMLVDGARTLDAGASQLASGATQLSSKLAEASAGAGSLASGASQVTAGASSLSGGIAAASAGTAKLSSGASSLRAGSATLADGAWSAVDGATSLHDGLARLESGASSLASGLTPAVGGSRELADGLTAGVDDVPSFTAAQRTANAKMMSDPVALGTTRLDHVPNYGTGFAPYFIPLALWVGALMAFFIAVPLSAKAVAEERDPLAVAVGGFWPGALIGVAQAVIMLLVLHFALGLQARSTLALYGFTILSAIVFIAILQFLSAALGAIGKFISIVLLMLQLTSAAGTFPLEWVPRFFQVINPYLPMTYVVAGLRQAISGGDWGVMGHDALVLAAFGVCALALTTITAVRARAWDPERLKPSLEV